MIVDADCHVSSGPISAVAISADALVTQMAGTSIDKALVWIAPPYERRIEIENRALYEAWQRHPERLLPFGWVNPRLGQASAQATIARCFEEYGFLGIKFNGAQDDYVIDDPVLSLPLIERAAAYGKPIAFHIGADAYENTHPYRLGRIAGLFPKTSLLMVHMGGRRQTVAGPSRHRDRRGSPQHHAHRQRVRLARHPGGHREIGSRAHLLWQ